MTFIVSAVVSAVGSNKAANTQADAAKNAQAISQQEFNTITGQEQPFMQAGYGAQSELNYLMGITPQGGGVAGTGFNMPGGSPNSPPSPLNMQPNQYGGGGFPNGWNGISAFRGGTPTGGQYPQANQGAGYGARPGAQQSAAGGFGSLVTPFTTQNWQQLSPMYNFDVQQGRQGVLNTDTSGQGSLSGAAAKDLINYNQGAANQSFGQAFNQYQTTQGNIFSRLSGIAQMGQNAAANTGLQGTALAGQAAQSATNIGSAQAAGQAGVAKALAGGAQNAIPWLTANGGGAPADWSQTAGGDLSYAQQVAQGF